MGFFKNQYLLITLFAFFLLGCSNDDDQNNILELKINSFQTSYSQVKINWEINRPNHFIIQDLLVYRTAKINDSDYFTEELIGNLPSNETVFVDNDVPYKTEVTYKIKLNYNEETKDGIISKSLESEPQKFIREIVNFNRVPFQVQKDPVQNNVFHILDNDGLGFLKKYNSTQNQVTVSKSFSNGNLLNNKFQIINNNEIYLADTEGKIYRLKLDDYSKIATYFAEIRDNLNAFAVDGDRIYYQDEELWGYYNILDGSSQKTGHVFEAQYTETLDNHNILFLFGGFAEIYDFNPQNCNGTNCSPSFIVRTNLPILTYSSLDTNIFSWNASKTKFITAIDGNVFNIASMKQEIKLSNITKKKYFQFTFDSENNIYATVQNEKKIHKFNSNYELIEVIDTKLYPLFPMMTSNGLKVIGGYEPVTYWNYGYGYSFNFNVKCAIETFE